MLYVLQDKLRTVYFHIVHIPLTVTTLLMVGSSNQTNKYWIT